MSEEALAALSSAGTAAGSAPKPEAHPAQPQPHAQVDGISALMFLLLSRAEADDVTLVDLDLSNNPLTAQARETLFKFEEDYEENGTAVCLS
jgi:hypothetical protein